MFPSLAKLCEITACLENITESNVFVARGKSLLECVCGTEQQGEELGIVFFAWL